MQGTDIDDDYTTALAIDNWIADDSFVVDATAIPGFPSVITAIVVAGLCFGIYYLMRKRARRVYGFAYHKIAKAEQKVE